MTEYAKIGLNPLILSNRCPILASHSLGCTPVPDPQRRNEAHVSFKIGDKVIYPNHGLGIVAKIEEKTIFGNTEGFFHLRILSTESTVLVPVANVDNVGLRRAISDEEVEELYRLLGDGHIDNHQNWKGRFKDNSDKMRTGSIYDMADVLKSLTFLTKSKSLSFREKRMLDRAKALIVSEISEVMRIKPEAVDARVNEQLEKCFAERARAVAAGEPLPPPRIIPPAPPRSTMPLPSVKPMSAPAPAAAKPVTPLQARVAQKSAQAVVAPKAAAAAAGVRQLSPSPKAAAKAPLAAKPAAPAKKKAVVRQAAPARKTAPTKSVSSKKTVAKAAPVKAGVARKVSSRGLPAKAAASKKAAPKSAAAARKADGRRGSASTVRKSSPKAAPKKKASASKPAARR
jgi:CarD family transcriptional regulator